MPAYPLSAISLETDLTPSPSIQVDPASDGAPRGRVINDSEIVENGQVVHQLLTTADKDTLLAFYAANRTAAITLTYGGQNYELYFLGRPHAVPLNGGGVYWRVVSRMAGKLL